MNGATHRNLRVRASGACLASIAAISHSLKIIVDVALLLTIGTFIFRFAAPKSQKSSFSLMDLVLASEMAIANFAFEWGSLL